MRLDHRDDGLLRSMLIEEIQRGLGGLGGNGRVHDRQAVLAFDDCHVGQVQVTHLVDPLHDLEQAGNIQKLRLPPQAGVDGIRGVGAFFDEVSLGWVPHQVALFALDHRRRQRRDGAVVGEIKKVLSEMAALSAARRSPVWSHLRQAWAPVCPSRGRRGVADLSQSFVRQYPVLFPIKGGPSRG